MRRQRKLWTQKASELRLVLTFVALVFAASVIIVAQVLSARAQTIADIKKNLLSELQITEKVLHASLKRVDDATQKVALEIGADPKLLSEDYIDKLFFEVRVLSDIPGLGLRLFDASGASVTGTNDRSYGPVPKDLSIADRPYFPSLKQGTPVTVSAPSLSKTRANHWQVVLSRRITGADGTFLGVIGASIDTDYLAEAKENFTLGRDDIFALISGVEPTMVARFPELQNVVGSEFKYHPNLAPVVRGEQHAGAYEGLSPFDGKRRFTAITRVGQFHLFAIAGRGMDAALSSWRRNSEIAIAILTLTVFSGAVLVWRQIRFNRILMDHQIKLMTASKMALLGEMAGGVAHEINNPLTIVHFGAYQLRQMVEKGKLDANAVVKAAETIEATAMRMSNITRGLSSFARDGGADPFKESSVVSIIDDTMSFCLARFKHHGIQLRIWPCPAELTIECRAVEISQLLLNLLGNASDAVETLEEKWVSVEVRDLDTHVELAVTDSGRGVPEEKQEKIFQPFYTTKEVGKGTGLGLSISKGIADSHHGLLFVDTKSANTRFVIRLPKRQTAQAKGQEAS